MDPFQGIVVHVISNEQILDLYDDPDMAYTDTNRTRQHYIEAITGTSFSVRVLLTTEYKLYDMKPTDAVEVTINIDGQNTSKCKYLRRRYLESRLLRGKPGECIFSGVTYFCPRAGQWMRSDYAFGKLKTKESADTSLSNEQIRGLGTIQILVKRVQQKMRDVPKPAPMETKCTTVGEVPEKALKGSTVTDTVGLTNARPIHAPEPSYCVCSPFPGPVGDVVEYKIYYRSKSALQIIGCIPRSPSPAIEVPGQGVASEGRQQEVQDLRARLALLERGLNVKPERTIGVKRELEEVEADARSRQRPRRSVKIETVDLTDD